MKLNIDHSAARAHTNRLEKLHRSALPLAIRGTLNSAAFDVKKTTMPHLVDQTFEKRRPNFFKANSRVSMATGWDVKSMQATVGFTGTNLRGGNNYAVKDLEQQEYGGKIKGRSFIPMAAARGGSNARPVRPSNRLSKIKNVVNSSQMRGKNRKEKFTKAAVKAGKGGYVMGNFPQKILYKITSLRRVKNRTVVKARALYSYEENRSVAVKATSFMRRSSLTSAKKMHRIYQKEAERQIKRLAK